MTIKDKVKAFREKYKDNLYYVDYYKNRDFYTSGPCTGKGSKGTHYIWTYCAQLKIPGKSYGEDFYANSLEELEEKVKHRLEERSKEVE